MHESLRKRFLCRILQNVSYGTCFHGFLSNVNTILPTNLPARSTSTLRKGNKRRQSRSHHAHVHSPSITITLTRYIISFIEIAIVEDHFFLFFTLIVSFRWNCFLLRRILSRISGTRWCVPIWSRSSGWHSSRRSSSQWDVHRQVGLDAPYACQGSFVVITCM